RESSAFHRSVARSVARACAIHGRHGYRRSVQGETLQFHDSPRRSLGCFHESLSAFLRQRAHRQVLPIAHRSLMILRGWVGHPVMSSTEGSPCSSVVGGTEAAPDSDPAAAPPEGGPTVAPPGRVAGGGNRDADRDGCDGERGSCRWSATERARHLGEYPAARPAHL